MNMEPLDEVGRVMFGWLVEPILFLIGVAVVVLLIRCAIGKFGG